MAINNNYFPQKSESMPTIYAYEDKYDPQLKGLLKVGYTTIGVQQRVQQQYNIKRPGDAPYRIVVEESAMRMDGSTFSDHDVHRQLRRNGCRCMGGEWYRCTAQQVRAAIVAVRDRRDSEWTRDRTFAMRPEQQAAVDKTAAYFESYQNEQGRTPHFLWNCKMRFGKTFTTYQLARRMGWTRVLVLTFKPAVAHAWEEDLKTHVDFEGWQFVARSDDATIDSRFMQADPERPMVVFGSFQDFLGKNSANGGMKLKHEWAREFNWDCIVLDEYHYGAWRDNARELIGTKEEPELASEIENPDYFDEDRIPITSRHYLYLSGTPFRAISSGEFIEEQIYNWTYSDEQRAKEEWGDRPDNPYASLPRMVLMTYQLPPAITHVAENGEQDEFDLNTFFAAEGKGMAAVFRHHDEVQKWLDMLRGQYLPASIDSLKTGNVRPPLPFSHGSLYANLNHTLWFLPNVAACHAMYNQLRELQNTFFHEYRINVCAGTQAGIGQAALEPVERSMAHPDPLHCKTITLTCGKLTTGVTVRPWTGIFMLRDTSSPETYFQAAFRVQSPWTIKNPDGVHPNAVEIMKQVCYVFDFSPNRALRKIADYSCQLNVNESNPERNVDDFIHFLPVLCYDNGVMRPLNAADVLDMAMNNTSATLLARRWESALLVSLNVFNESLMNDAVYKFKRYEDASLSYAGINRHAEESKLGTFSAVVQRDE